MLRKSWKVEFKARELLEKQELYVYMEGWKLINCACCGACKQNLLFFEVPHKKTKHMKKNKKPDTIAICLDCLQITSREEIINE